MESALTVGIYCGCGWWRGQPSRDDVWATQHVVDERFAKGAVDVFLAVAGAASGVDALAPDSVMSWSGGVVQSILNSKLPPKFTAPIELKKSLLHQAFGGNCEVVGILY